MKRKDKFQQAIDDAQDLKPGYGAEALYKLSKADTMAFTEWLTYSFVKVDTHIWLHPNGEAITTEQAYELYENEEVYE